MNGNSTNGVRACGSYECKAAQRDGVLCADGECRDADGVPEGEAGRRMGLSGKSLAVRCTDCCDLGCATCGVQGTSDEQGGSDAPTA